MILARSSIVTLWLIGALVRVQRSLAVALVCASCSSPQINSGGAGFCRTSSGRASSKTPSSACSSPVASSREAPMRPLGSVLRRVSPSSSLTLSSGARDVRGCSGLVNSDGMRRPSGSACSKGSSVVVMHGHRMCNDIDLDSVFVPHSRFSLCSSVVSGSSQRNDSCGEHGSALGHKNSCNSHAVEQRRLVRVLDLVFGVGRLAAEELASPQQIPGRLHDETWAGLFCGTRARGFPGWWKSFRSVLLQWLVLHVLITLLSDLGQAELFGTCWVGHSWRKQIGLVYGCSLVPSKERIFFFP